VFLERAKAYYTGRKFKKEESMEPYGRKELLKSFFREENEGLAQFAKRVEEWRSGIEYLYWKWSGVAYRHETLPNEKTPFVIFWEVDAYDHGRVRGISLFAQPRVVSFDESLMGRLTEFSEELGEYFTGLAKVGAGNQGSEVGAV